MLHSVLSATNAFAYNQHSEVTNAEMHAATYAYSYNDIGNRKWATADAVANTYEANQLNQYSAVTNAGENSPVTYDLDGNTGGLSFQNAILDKSALA